MGIFTLPTKAYPTGHRYAGAQRVQCEACQHWLLLDGDFEHTYESHDCLGEPDCGPTCHCVAEITGMVDVAPTPIWDGEGEYPATPEEATVTPAEAPRHTWPTCALWRGNRSGELNGRKCTRKAAYAIRVVTPVGRIISEICWHDVREFQRRCAAQGETIEVVVIRNGKVPPLTRGVAGY